MGETQNLRAVRVDKYDPLKGRYIRDIKTTDIVNIYEKASPTSNDTVSWDMVTYTTDANSQIFPYIFGAHHCGTSTCPQFILQNGTGTVDIMALQTDINGEGQNLVTGCNCPLTRVGESSQILIHVNNATNTTDTYCAWLVAKREPILSVVEDA